MPGSCRYVGMFDDAMDEAVRVGTKRRLARRTLGEHSGALQRQVNGDEELETAKHRRPKC